MAIVKQSVPYEMLVRFNADGTVRGRHIKYLDRIYDEDTGEVYAEKEGNALPVKEGGILPEVALGEVAAALAKGEEALHIERDELAAAKQAIETELQTERAARQLAEAQKDTALAEVERVRNEVRDTPVTPVVDPGPR
jgi:hypothetical protein